MSKAYDDLRTQREKSTEVLKKIESSKIHYTRNAINLGHEIFEIENTTPTDWNLLEQKTILLELSMRRYADVCLDEAKELNNLSQIISCINKDKE